MKNSLLGILIFSSLAPLSAQAKCSAETVAIASDYLKHVTISASVGGRTRIELLWAQIAFEDASECAGTISLKDYCEATTQYLADLQKLTLLRQAMGTGQPTDVTQTIQERIQVERKCN